MAGGKEHTELAMTGTLLLAAVVAANPAIDMGGFLRVSRDAARHRQDGAGRVRAAPSGQIGSRPVHGLVERGAVAVVAEEVVSHEREARVRV